MPKEENSKYSYNRFGSKGARVGQAIVDILSTAQPEQTVGDVLDSAAVDFVKEMEDCIQKHKDRYTSPFYILVLTKKEFYANNLVRNYLIPRQTPPYAFEMMEQFSNYTKTLYIVDAHAGHLKTLWSLPAFSECIDIARAPGNFDDELVKWVEACFNRKLDKDSYTFDWSIWD
jgi:hypothetical protein